MTHSTSGNRLPQTGSSPSAPPPSATPPSASASTALADTPLEITATLTNEEALRILDLHLGSIVGYSEDGGHVAPAIVLGLGPAGLDLKVFARRSGDYYKDAVPSGEPGQPYTFHMLGALTSNSPGA